MCNKEKIDLLEKILYYMYHNVNFSSGDQNKPWYSEELDEELTNKELAEFLHKKIKI